ncbi:MAG TPA: spore germination protein GerW family protein [Solirubrobacteraceae bacterium]|nr:spore germination protein GerW family protein [Solirubrobacteraceae bacterium]
MSSQATVEERAARAAQEAGALRRRAKGDELLGGMAERIGARLEAATVFGTPVERDGVTVVPVAAGRFGFGAGSGSGTGREGEGEGEGVGGGGGGAVKAIGYIELRDGKSRFVPVVDPARMMIIGCAMGLAVLLLRRRSR